MGIGSRDGTVRPFDANACGTMFGSGAGIVVLKRIEAAIADRDFIHAVIRGTGNFQVGWSAGHLPDFQSYII
jgi:acyl transferase domain-containing protein